MNNGSKTQILFNQTAFLGDLLLSIPTLKRLRVIFPNSHITLVCRKGTASLMQELSLVDEVYEVDKKNSESIKLLNENVLKKTFDLAISPHESPRSAIFMKRIKAKDKIGFHKWWSSWIYTKTHPRNMNLPDALRQLSLLSDLDLEVKETIQDYLIKKEKFGKLRFDSLEDRLMVPPIASMGLKQTIQTNLLFHVVQKYPDAKNGIFVAPGSVWNTKKWTLNGYIELCKNLSGGRSVILIGSADEKELCDQIEKEVPGIINLAGKTTLFELLCLMTLGKFLVCNDSGAMHLGSVAEIPTVAIFGPTVLEIGYQPWQDTAIVVEKIGLKCRPCGLHGHHKCPIGTHECMVGISARDVAKAIQKIPSH